MADPVALFVYGTLRSDARHPMGEWLRERATLLGRGTVSARIRPVGPHRGLMPCADGELIAGEVYHIHEWSEVIDRLDDYEGREYKRRIVDVMTDRGTVAAWAYVVDEI